MPHVPQRLRQEVAERTEFLCEYCRSQQIRSFDVFEIDHVIPRAAGGETVSENLALACPHCNNAKRSRVTAVDLQTGRRVRLFHPRTQNWGRHFQWSEDFGEVLGKTAAGRATVAALRMNRPHVIEMRRLLAAMGEHPPESE
ncbi:MAG: HNH endonuclease [Planctomycetaceae bacterium]